MKFLRRNAGQIVINSILALLAVLTFVPIATLINLSFKDTFQFGANPMGITLPLAFSNYELAWQFMRDPLWHNVVIAAVSITASLSMAALTAFVFARFDFPGRDTIFFGFLLILFVPGTILLVPTFQLIVHFHLQNTLWSLILPYAAHQSLIIFVLRSFFTDLPAEMFDAAKVDGAGTLQQLWRIAIPLALPALSAMAIFQVWWIWNDYAWPTLVANSTNARTAVSAVIFFNDGMARPEPGAGMAAAVIASLPMVLLFLFTMRTFVAGLTAGAVKQ
ncbi:MAG: carbohydrate ABC transporter permease [Caldilineaceae bacterium]|nr:carbohydrate ABC transporter permease [Caldilineaceae bacterium]MBP9071444.1 carbohydrate ABC transporter permease [Caldilineaceae bacterium]